jgi:HlyD family secretion protein
MTADEAVRAPAQAPPAAPSQAPAAESGGTRTGARARRRLLPFLVVLVLAGAAVWAWRTWFAVPPVPDSIVTLSGRIEGDDSAIGPKVAGKILAITVREGDTVKAGEVIALLDDSQIRAQEDQARAAVNTAQAQAQSARDQIAVLQEQVQQNQLQTEQSVTDAQGRVHQAEADLAAAQANLAQQKASYQMAAFNKDAYTTLYREGAVSDQQRVQAVAAADQQAAAVAAAERQVSSSRGALVMAQATLANPNIHGAQTAAVERQIVQQQAMIAAANAQVAQARAQLAEAEANRQDLIVRAPFSGTVTTRAAEPGEVVPAGTAIVTLLNLDQVYLRGFIPEGQIGKVKIGQPAHVYLDSNPSQPVPGSVLRIDPEAMFTPENTYFREDRVNEVVGVKIQLNGAFGYAKPGMPADGEILVSGTEWPKGWKGWHSP